MRSLDPLPGLRLVAALALAFWPLAASGESTPCEGTPVTVLSATATEAEKLCSRVRTSLDMLTSCNVPLTHPVTVQLRDSLSPGCMGFYHCGEERIELLSPKAMAPLRRADGSLAFVDVTDYFQSILTHELAHAAYASVPCPFDGCLATNEYVAHVMQVMSLSEADRAQLESTLDMDTPLSRDSVNAMIYMMAPDVFLRRAWVHFRQQPDSCAFMDDIMQGRVLFDVERFE